MLNSSITTAATLRPRSGSPFVAPAGTGFWQLPESNTGNAAGIAGFASGPSSHNAPFMVSTPPPMAGVDTRMTAKTDRPPRGVPR